jgi:hypothetical protein
MHDAIALRAATLSTIGAVLGLPGKPTWLDGLTSAPMSVVHELDQAELSRTAIVLFASEIALRKAGLSHPRADRDARDAAECVFAAFFLTYGGVKQTPVHTREYHQVHRSELAAEAKRLVELHWIDIQTDAIRRAAIAIPA